MKKIIIAIDGYSGTGKSSTAKAVAKELGYLYIDSGAMYRAVTYYFNENRINLNNEEAVRNALSQIHIEFDLDNGRNDLRLNGQLLSDELRTQAVNQSVSAVSTIPAIRRALVSQQQQLGRNKGIVMDGRDIGTVVFPEAELKVFMNADIAVRAERRKLELNERGIPSELGQIKKNLAERDQIDSGRDDSPLRKPDGALEIDTSDLTFEEQVEKITTEARKRIDED